MVSDFPLVLQKDSDDCGAAALASVLRFWGHPASPESVEAAIGGKNRRLSAGEMADHARKAGLRAYVFFGTMDDVLHELDQGRPIIVGLGKEQKTKRVLSHYEVVVGYEPKKRLVLLLDPGEGFQIDTLEGFGREWAYSKGVTIVTFLSEDDARLSDN
jgi:ABC-type bacteriocin/lantibiotic exporter with double-glycine peptidase domain